MTAVMKGVRVIEVAEYAFVPGTGALLADWGAEVIKVEPAERGDAARGLNDDDPNEVSVSFHHTNRGKKSIGLDLATDEGREILYQLVKTADVFLSNKQPRVRKKLKIDVEDIRAQNPNIIYMRGTGQGAQGPEAERGAFDLITFWHRTGASSTVASRDGEIPFLPAPGFGDFTGSMFIAGGVMGALYHRERTGEAPVVDVSLLSTGMWSMGSLGSVAASEGEFTWPPGTGTSGPWSMRNPLAQVYPTRDSRHIALCCLQTGHYWPLLCNVIERPDLADDPRFKDHDSIMTNFRAVEDILTQVFSERPLDEWCARLADFPGQWVAVQNILQSVNDPQVLANGYVQDCQTADGKSFKLVSAPVQYDGHPAVARPGPAFNEHGDEILADLGFDMETVLDLKFRGIVT